MQYRGMTLKAYGVVTKMRYFQVRKRLHELLSGPQKVAAIPRWGIRGGQRRLVVRPPDFLLLLVIRTPGFECSSLSLVSSRPRWEIKCDVTRRFVVGLKPHAVTR